MKTYTINGYTIQAPDVISAISQIAVVERESDDNGLFNEYIEN